ncbi:ChaN family lipoprotein [Pararhodospirillum photometricum]|uniref:ChaN family lipoprotein n=1 Tax=Pararhodospirillum photometricum TaxID=1084 RepID=UPI0002D4BFE1|nr:ChaN family lipoprotein [Pararhodospirillum photometricum]
MWRRIGRWLSAVGVSGALAGCAVGPGPSVGGGESPPSGRIIDTRTGTPLTPAALVARLAEADVVLLGERHDNPDHHAGQAFLYQALIDQGRRPALVMEMLDQGQEAAIMAAQAAPESAATALAWEERGWPDFAWYAPVLRAAWTAGLPVTPGNLPRETIRAVVRAGQLPAGLDVSRPLPPQAQADLETELRDSHCGMLPEALLPGMVRAQRVRDAVMAEAVLRHRPSVLIAGWGHTRRDRPDEQRFGQKIADEVDRALDRASQGKK